MHMGKALWLAVGLVSGASLAGASSLVFVCDPTIDATVAGTCNTLNTTIAGLYDSIFSNVNARIYIQYGTTGLGESTSGFLNLISYNTYLTALTDTSSGSAFDTSAVNSLPAGEPSIYSGGRIEVTSALGAALGISGLRGTTSGGAVCFTPGVGDCYNGIITITTPANLSSESSGTQTLYYRNGVQPGNAYDFYTIVEHETDEILGTESCVDTNGGLSDGCRSTNASAADLFRYNAGSRVFMSQTPGAYFSYDGGVTQLPRYSTLPNGDDYGDFLTTCEHVQDGIGCLGQSFDITNDGGPEIAILNAIGYNLQPVPEPGGTALIGAALVVLEAYRRGRVV